MHVIEWLSLIGLSLIVVLTIIGNLLILLVILLKHKLRANVTNRLIASLAAADLLLGVIVMPFAVVDQLRYIHLAYIPVDLQTQFDVWIFGQDWCDLWHAFDVLSSTASILNLCVISLERYIAISDPFNYPTRMTPSKSICMIVTVWICSAFISFPAIIWWRFTETKLNSTSPNPIGTECIFSKDTTYLLLSSSISFYVPLIVMVVVYCRIYRTARKLLRTFTTGQKFIQNKSLSGGASILRVHRGGTCKHSPSVYGRDFKSSTSLSGTVSSNKPSRPDDCPSNANANGNMCLAHEGPTSPSPLFFQPNVNPNVHFDEWTSTTNPNTTTSSCHSNLWHYTDAGQLDLSIHTRNPISDFRRRFKRFVKDRKAAKTLGIVMGVFILCWLPFFVYNTLKAIYPMILVSQDHIIFPLVTWLGYINSTINPFVYAFSLRDFQKALIDLTPRALRLRKRDCRLVNYPKKRRLFVTQTQVEHLHPYDSLNLDISDRQSSPNLVPDSEQHSNQFNFPKHT